MSLPYLVLLRKFKIVLSQFKPRECYSPRTLLYQKLKLEAK